MIIVSGYVNIKPGHRDAAVDAIKVCVAATRAEAGNIDYRFSIDLDDPHRLNIYEEWVSIDDLMAHVEMPHLATMRAALDPLREGPSVVVRHEVTGSGPL